MINPLEAVANLAKPVAMQVLLARERLESGVAYNPVSEEVATDPYAVYRRLRNKDPIHRMRLIDAAVDMALLIANIAGSRTVETPPMRYGIELSKHELILDGYTGMASIGKLIELRKRDKAGEQALVLLEDGASLTVKEIAERCEISEPTTRRALEELEGQGKVIKSGGRPARYRLPAD